MKDWGIAALTIGLVCIPAFGLEMLLLWLSSRDRKKGEPHDVDYWR